MPPASFNRNFLYARVEWHEATKKKDEPYVIPAVSGIIL